MPDLEIITARTRELAMRVGVDAAAELLGLDEKTVLKLAAGITPFRASTLSHAALRLGLIGTVPADALSSPPSIA